MNSNEKILEFLEYYKQYPEIWDSTNVNHKNRNKVADTWHEIRNQLGLLDVSIDLLKKKKESLMSTYRALKKKVLLSKKSGAGSDEIFKPNWFAYDVMDSFLCNAGKIRQTLNTEACAESVYSPEEEFVSEPEETETVAAGSQANDTESEQTHSYESLLDARGESQVAGVTGPSKKSFLSPQKNTLKRKSVIPQGGVEKSMRLAANALQSISQGKSCKDDECSLFAQLLATRLSAFNLQNRKILMNQIENLVFNAEMEGFQQQYPFQSIEHSARHAFQHSQSAAVVQTPLCSPSLENSNTGSEHSSLSIHDYYAQASNILLQDQ